MKKLLAILLSVMILATSGLSVFALSFGSDEITEAIPAVTSHSFGGSTMNSASKIVENDKYIFVAFGRNAVKSFSAKVTVYDKATGEEITDIVQPTTQGTYHCPVRDMEILGDKLYINWGNCLSSGTVYRASGPKTSDTASTLSGVVYGYNVSNVAEDSTFTVANGGIQYFHGTNSYKNTTPYFWGGRTYLDEKNSWLYTMLNVSSQSDKKGYFIYDVGENGSATPIYRFLSPNMDAAKFLVKGDYLIEIVQKNMGLTTWTGTATGPNFNEIHIYDLKTALTNFTQGNSKWNDSLTNYLVGKYVTTLTGDTAINDVEVIGNTMYVATTAGIEVVDLTNIKLLDEVADLSKLPANKTIKSAYGAAMDLEVVGNKLVAGFAGSDVWSTVRTSDTAKDKGAVIVYDSDMNVNSISEVTYGVADVAVDADAKKVYIVNDTLVTTSISAVSAIDYVESSLVLENSEGTTEGLAAGIFDVKVKLSHSSSSPKGVLICALYEGNKLSEMLYASNPTIGADGTVTLAEDYTIGSNVTHVKTMFFSDLDTALNPLCDFTEIK